MNTELAQPFLSLQNVSKYFADFCALDTVSLECVAGPEARHLRPLRFWQIDADTLC